MRVCIIFFVLASLALASHEEHRSGSAIKKVIQMLTDMEAKGKKEKQDEQVRFASYKQFCVSTGEEKTKAIASSKDEIEQLKAAIGKAEADAQSITEFVAALDQDVATWTDDLAAARAERKKQKAAFGEAHKEYVDSIAAVDRAVELLKKGPGQSFAQISDNVASLLQVQAAKLPLHKRRVLMSFLQKQSPGAKLLQEAAELDDGVAPPEVAAYESSSGGVIEMVEQLGEKFYDEKVALEKREANQKSAFNMLSADLESSIETAGMERGMKESSKAELLEEAAAKKGELGDTTAALAEDEKFLKDLNSECETKEFDYTKRQEMRQGEIEAIGKAIEIMSSTADAGAKHLGLAQRAVSLAQLRSKQHSLHYVQQAAANFLREQARSMKSNALLLIASKVGADPFKKVKKMIQDMITKLMEEANADAEQKAFCDAEMGTNKQTRDRKTEESESLKADIEEYTATIAKLAEEITGLSEDISAVDAAVAKATSERDEEKAKNTETIQEATTAEAAVGQALQILKEFYEKAAEPIEQPAPQQGPIAWDNRAIQILKGGASLLQGRVPGAPEMEEGQYTGMANGGVLGLMEVVQSDFAKVLSETTASEADAARIYEEFMADCSQDKAVKEADMKHKATSKSEKESALATAKKDLRITQEELFAALEYYEKLKPSCEQKVMSYEEKVAQRKAEIESLQEALEILSGTSI
jgi:hypothetical protein